MRVEACGICPTDVRKFEIGADHYPLNSGHEWVALQKCTEEKSERIRGVLTPSPIPPSSGMARLRKARTVWGVRRTPGVMVVPSPEP